MYIQTEDDYLIMVHKLYAQEVRGPSQLPHDILCVCDFTHNQHVQVHSLVRPRSMQGSS